MFTALGTGTGSFCSKFLPCESDKLKEMMLRSPHLGTATVVFSFSVSDYSPG